MKKIKKLTVVDLVSLTGGEESSKKKKKKYKTIKCTFPGGYADEGCSEDEALSPNEKPLTKENIKR